MARKIMVNTDAIKDVANILIRESRDMQTDFDTLNNKVKSMHNSWQSQASDKAKANFDTIGSNMKSAETVFINYSNMLLKVVGAGYEEVEVGNKSLADSFK